MLNNTLNNNNATQAFEMLEKIDSFKADIALIAFSIESNPAAQANERITAEKARLENINRASRIKRLKKFNSLNDGALSIVASNVDADTLEKTAIYAQDKIAQLARFLSGSDDVFGRGRNNTALYALRGLAVHSPAIMTTAFLRGQLERYGQPVESSSTQASSSAKALAAFGFVTECGRGQYRVNYNNELLSALLDACGSK